MPGIREKLNKTHIPIRPSMSPEVQFEAALRYDRNRQLDRIFTYLKTTRSALEARESSPAAVNVHAGHRDGSVTWPPPTPPPYHQPPTTCSEFDEIEECLFRNRQELALDTAGWMPENAMYHYIKWNGGLDIDVPTWRAFLQICDEREHLFWYGSRDIC